MTFRSREAILAASEDYSPDLEAGSLLFCNPLDVELWSPAFRPTDILPITPPESPSDCDLYDCPDMDDRAWSQTSFSGQWTADSTQSSFVLPQSATCDWQSHHAVPATTSAVPPMDMVSWLDLPQGPLDLTLSPVPSAKSQSTHTLNSLSEPDLGLMPPGMELSFLDHPEGIQSTHPEYLGVLPTDAPKDGRYPSTISFQDLTQLELMQTSVNAPVGLPITHVVPSGGSNLPSRRTHLQSQMRPLLPRTDVSYTHERSAYEALRASQPQSKASARPVASASHVSKVARHLDQVPAPVMPSASAINGYGDSAMSSNGLHGNVLGADAASKYQERTITPNGSHLQDSEDFSTFLDLEHEDAELPNTGLSPGRTTTDFATFAPSSVDLPTNSYTTLLSGDVAVRDETLASPIAPPMVTVNKQHVRPEDALMQHTIGDTDEGRHRTHHYYSEVPREDGRYHCPFWSEASKCHQPTKLKCNYDKFIDSHLKPFRCKNDSCTKLAFSSTACLLRHEREAHGMHGHGERPHQCFYHGCERGTPGNGFPRRYNLYDHMKRVHGYKEPIESTTGRSNEADKRNGGRKRKAAGAHPTEPVSQRHRTMPIVTQNITVLPANVYLPDSATLPMTIPEGVYPNRT